MHGQLGRGVQALDSNPPALVLRAGLSGGAQEKEILSRMIKHTLSEHLVYEYMRKRQHEGAIGFTVCKAWMHSNSVDSHLQGQRHTKRMAARGHQAMDAIFETHHKQRREHRPRDSDIEFLLLALWSS